MIRIMSFAAAFAALLSASQQVRGQNAPSVINLFGGIIQGAMTDSARREWAMAPAWQRDCVARQGYPADRLSSAGIAPSTAQAQSLISGCSPPPYAPPPSIATGYNSHFKVGGIPLGARVNGILGGYTCKASEDYPGFAYCHQITRQPSPLGPQQVANTIYPGRDGNAYYIFKSIEPASLTPQSVQDEIHRISQQFNLPPHIIQTGNPNAIVVTWGDIVLSPLDQSLLDEIKNGSHSIHQGLLFDSYGSPLRSATEGYRVFRFSGGVGYVYGANWDADGRGVLRLVTVDANILHLKNAPSSPEVAATNLPPDASSFVAPSPPTQDNSSLDRDFEALKQKRLEQLKTAAKQMVEDASGVVKSNPQNPQLLTYVEKIAAVNEALSASDPDDLERKTVALQTLLNRDSAYQKLEATRAEQQRQTAARYLSETINLAQKQRAFMMHTLSSDPTSPASAKFVSLVRLVEPALAKPDMSKLQPITESIGLAIREVGLQTSFASFVEADQTAYAANSDDTKKTTIPITEQNRFLLEGDVDDLLLVYNSGPKAPHAIRNLRGDIVFKDGRADVCVFGQASDDALLLARSKLTGLGVSTVAGLEVACRSGRLRSYDVLVVPRGSFLRQELSDAAALVELVQTHEIQQLVAISASDLKVFSAEQKSLAAENSAQVSRGGRDGFGIIFLANSSQKLCASISDRPDAHARILLNQIDQISLRMHASPTVVFGTSESSYEAASRGECGAFYAAASDLKSFAEAMIRDQKSYSFSSVWVTPDMLKAAVAAADEQKKQSDNEAAAMAQKFADERKLAEVRQKDMDSTSQAKQTAWRAQYEGTATSSSSAIANDVRDGTMNHSSVKLQVFPHYADWLDRKLMDHWEVMEFNSSLQDFGLSNFKGRSLDAALSRVQIKLKNRILGEYKESCWLFGRVTDAEFSMYREPMDVPCEDARGLQAWENGLSFQSRWFVN